MDEEEIDSRPGIGYLIYTFCGFVLSIAGIAVLIYAAYFHTSPQ